MYSKSGDQVQQNYIELVFYSKKKGQTLHYWSWAVSASYTEEGEQKRLVDNDTCKESNGANKLWQQDVQSHLDWSLGW